MSERHLSCLRRVQLIVLAFCIILGAGIAALSGFDMWQRRAVAVDLVLTHLSSDDAGHTVRMNWHNRRDCDYTDGSLKFVNNDPDDDLTPRTFLEITPLRYDGSRGIGPQEVDVFLKSPENWSPIFYVVASHLCGDTAVRSRMGVFKTASIIPEVRQ